MPDDSRARLIAYLSRAGLSTARANAVLDNYAHSLAEQIRKDCRFPTYLLPEEAADLIDPKVAA